MKNASGLYTRVVKEKKPVRDALVRLGPDRLDALREPLLSWFLEHGRDLPWRYTRDPYHVLVSEALRRQIQVVRAVPFYLAVLERFPTVEALAEGPIAEAIGAWRERGRYRREVTVQRPARIVVK